MHKPIEERLMISLPDLKRRGFFARNRSGSIIWLLGDNVLASIWVRVNYDEENLPEGGTLRVHYTQNGQFVEEQVDLVHIASNLGRGGGIWYFVCPQTHRRCRILIKGRYGFVSRHDEGGMRYQAQLRSHSQRAFYTGLRILKQKARAIEAVEWFSNPHCKRSYGGKLTRPMHRYLKLRRTTQQLND
ncbi:hypothetical protein [Spirosoma endbachense]|uniref:Uncharacterized protein n=1 Tax=Spirosoma endbachense TaxID=2666025 RepID=A0A6P1VZY5_9BACT|nr:hypothetical protein [Spirosoma endbachense]QHV97289.1 hypothetical protein GJR95_20770 [Spirosoma endbachense]